MRTSTGRFKKYGQQEKQKLWFGGPLGASEGIPEAYLIPCKHFCKSKPSNYFRKIYSNWTSSWYSEAKVESTRAVHKVSDAQRRNFAGATPSEKALSRRNKNVRVKKHIFTPPVRSAPAGGTTYPRQRHHPHPHHPSPAHQHCWHNVPGACGNLLQGRPPRRCCLDLCATSKASKNVCSCFFANFRSPRPFGPLRAQQKPKKPKNTKVAPSDPSAPGARVHTATPSSNLAAAKPEAAEPPLRSRTCASFEASARRSLRGVKLTILTKQLPQRPPHQQSALRALLPGGFAAFFGILII